MITVLEGEVAEIKPLGSVIIGFSDSDKTLRVDAAGNIEMPQMGDDGYDADLEEEAPPAKLAISEQRKSRWSKWFCCC